MEANVNIRSRLVALLLLALVMLAGAAAARAQEAERESKQAVVTVEGMQCPFCAYGIKKHLSKLPGARKVEVELARNQAVVTFEPDATAGNEEIKQAVRKAGFTAGSIEWRPARANGKSGQR